MGNRLLGGLFVCAVAALVAAAPAFSSQSPFFLDTHNQLWAATDNSGKNYLFSGASGVQLSVGEVDPSGGGGEIAVVRTAKNRVLIFNGNNNVVTKTRLAAVDIAAGRGEVFVRRPNDTIAVLTLGALNPDGTFSRTVIGTNARARQLSVGFDFTTTRDFLAFRSPSNRVRFMEVLAGVPEFGSSDLTAIDVVAGNQKETFLRRHNNRIAVLTIDTATAAGITLQAPIRRQRQAVEMGVSRNNPSGNDFVAFRALDNSVHFANFAPGAPSSLSAFMDVPGAVAKQVVAGVTEIFIRRPNDRVQYFTLNAAGTGIASSPLTGMFAAKLRDTRFTLGPGVIDQISAVNGHRLFVSQNNAGGDAIASFFNTGFFVEKVGGFDKFP
jgi:hypothetical protein